MQAAWRVGNLFGIPLYIDSSWMVVVALITFVYGTDFAENWGPAVGYSAGLFMALALFGSVLLHELGHSLVARSQGIQVNSITLFLFGGIASIDKESKTPILAFQVAIAGPAVSFMLFGLLAIAAQLVSQQPVWQELASLLSRINFVLAAFNMLPGLPLDGGQIVKAAVWQFTGSRYQGVHWAARSGQFLGWTAIALGLFVILNTGDAGGFWIMLIGWFAIRNANAYDRLTTVQEALMQVQAANIMTREFRVVDGHQTLREFADEYLLSEKRSSIYFVASDGRYRGLLCLEDLRFLERSLWETQTLDDIAHPLDTLVTVREQTPLYAIINTMETHNLNWITVLSPADAVSGIIDKGDVVLGLAQHMNMLVPETEIKRIKEEGTYPQGFQLAAIAQSVAEKDGDFEDSKKTDGS
ncbi:site-2 protease family protein [Geitlerinema sp. PCC 9228]|jgi:Zn-dependent protease/CBS domain-containing protein|uniref:site-2 protease family protein n=1 Tax=Geitlerinema sp. PCC 9228 TaxID=111611 RepID=UPI0008F99A9C|nr:site-2 protease family protein [Geitlerinema sp. PCC 9228]